MERSLARTRVAARRFRFATASSPAREGYSTGTRGAAARSGKRPFEKAGAKRARLAAGAKWPDDWSPGPGTRSSTAPGASACSPDAAERPCAYAAVSDRRGRRRLGRTAPAQAANVMRTPEQPESAGACCEQRRRHRASSGAPGRFRAVMPGLPESRRRASGARRLDRRVKLGNDTRAGAFSLPISPIGDRARSERSLHVGEPHPECASAGADGTSVSPGALSSMLPTPPAPGFPGCVMAAMSRQLVVVPARAGRVRTKSTAGEPDECYSPHRATKLARLKNIPVDTLGILREGRPWPDRKPCRSRATPISTPC
jgi:hypothetical protein